MIKANGLELMVEDLARSGIDQSEIDLLGFEPLSVQETADITNFKVFSYIIPYFDVHGREIEFYRIKLFHKAKTLKNKLPKYLQLEDSRPHVYFPPYIAWEEIMNDPRHGLLITEGEKKAIKGALCDLNVIGLGGVWSWKSKKQNIDFLPELESFVWDKREVLIVFDSDMQYNERVLVAMKALAKELFRRKAKVSYVFLPEENGSKVGLDDYLLTSNKEDLLALPRKTLELEDKMSKMNEKLAYVEDLNEYLILEHCRFSSLKKLRDNTFAQWLYTQELPNGQTRQALVVDQWVKWEGRTTYRSVDYLPGKPPITEDNIYNLWRPPTIEPIEGDVAPFINFLELLCNFDEVKFNWLLQYISFMIQHPDVRIEYCLILFGADTGTGKSLFCEILKQFFGSNAVNAQGDELKGQFTDFLFRKQLVIFDDFNGIGDKKTLDALKSIITTDRMLLNQKYGQKIDMSIWANIIISSNRSYAVPIEPNDRRFVIFEVKSHGVSIDDYVQLSNWAKSTKGRSAIYHFLLSYDCSKFQPKGMPLMTEERGLVEVSTRSAYDEWVVELIQNPIETLRLRDKSELKPYWTLPELYKKFVIANVDDRYVSRRLLLSSLLNHNIPRTEILQRKEKTIAFILELSKNESVITEGQTRK